MRRRLNYANVTATLALFFAMSGGALAAKHYLINSTKQINPKVLKALKGANGAPGTSGTNGTPGKEGSLGKEGPQGKEGKEGPFPAGNVPHGVTIRGTYAVGGTASKSARFFWDQIAFGFQFASAPKGHYIEEGTTPPAECPGSPTNPQASPGHLCVYEGIRSGSFTGAVFDPSTGETGGTTRWGAGIFLTTSSKAEENVFSYGTWAATTP